MAKTGSHCDDVILDIAKVQPDLRSWRNLPSLVTAFGKALDNIGLVAKQAVQTHHPLTTVAHTKQHVARRVSNRGRVIVFLGDDLALIFQSLVCDRVQSQDSIVNLIDFVLDASDQRLEHIRDVVDDGIGNPVRR